MRFQEWAQIREADESALVSGEGVRALQSAMKSKSGELAGSDRDSYSSMLAAGHLDARELQLGQVLKMMRIVSKHGDYGRIRSMVNDDIASALQGKISKVLSPSVPAPASSRGKIKVFDRSPKEYGKFKVHIPGGIESLRIESELNRIIDSVLRSEGDRSKSPPRFKKLQGDRSNREHYWIHPTVMKQIMELMKSKGFSVVYESGSDSASPDNTPAASPDIQVLGRIRDRFGNKVAVRFNYERAKGLFDKMADVGLRPNGISYDRDNKRFLINIDDLNLFDRVLAQIKAHGLDTKPLEDFAASIGHNPSDAGTDPVPVDKDDVFTFTDAPGDSMIVKTHIDKLPFHIRGFIRESIQYNFPEYKYDFERWQYTVTGNFKQYVTFGQLLSRFGYKVDNLREIVKKKLADGRLKKTEYEGRYDKDKEFQDSIQDRLPDSMVDLYDEQKFGVAFLYGRDSAILGDETGFGKCLLPESWIQTNEGMMSIEQIWNLFAENLIINENGEEWAKPSSEIYVHSMDSNQKIVKSKVVGLYREKINSWVKEIKTSNGRTIRSTIPHRFYTGEGWKYDIAPGDLICSSPNLPSLQHNDFEDGELATILAWQISEGWESNKRATVRIFQKDISVLERIQELLSKKGTKSTIYERNTSLGLVVNSKEYKTMLESMGYAWGKKSAEKSVPEFIMNANNDIVKLFLRSFFDAECYVNPRCRQLELSTASEKMAKQIQVLLWRFGIFCICHEHMKMATNGSRTLRKYHTIYVCGSSIEKFFKEIGLDYEYKINSFLNISTEINPNKEGKPVHRILRPFFDKYKIPTRLLKIPSKKFVTGERMATNRLIEVILDSMEKLKSGIVLEEYLKLKKSKWTKSTLSALNSVAKKDLEEAIFDLRMMLENDLYYEKVLNVTKVRYKGYVYDLCVEGTQNYIANGLVCHNTIQLITAAALRMQANDKPTLIITLKATQKQFAEEILRVVGEKERDQISMDPMNPKKWTVIRYSDFSGGAGERSKKVLANIESLKRAGFGVAILDELHKVKHGKSQRAQNISAAIQGIPTRWGASATVSSNKPMDVKNQLLVMGHQLGRVSEAKFKKDFAGMEAGGYKGRLKKTDDEEKEIQAAERLNKWLNLSGVYVRREKGDIRDMPDLSVDSEETGINAGMFQSMYASKLQTYKNPDLAVSRLIAAREVVAQLKTDETTFKVLEIVNAGEGKPPAASKVVVFTNFIGAGRLLVDKISKALKTVNPEYKVITYLSDTKRKEREEVKERFTNDPEIKVLVMSMKMGGTGIDFPNAAQHMIINDFDWTPESAEQSEGRIYRINTDHAVRIQYVVGRGIDQELFERVQKKREIAAIIQKYRREYHDSESSPEALRKIVAAQKEIKKIDDEMIRIVSDNLPGAEDAMKEGFSAYLSRLESFSEAMNPED